MKTYNAIEVAQWLLAEAQNQNLTITPMQLQKILYYCQGEYIGMTGHPLFFDDIEAWEHGPVTPSVYREYRAYGRDPITPTPCKIPEDLEGFIRHCIREKGSLSAYQLRKATHNESPYMTTRLNHVITIDKLKEFFVKEMYGPDEEDIYVPDYTAEQAIEKAASFFTEDELNDLISTL